MAQSQHSRAVSPQFAGHDEGGEALAPLITIKYGIARNAGHALELAMTDDELLHAADKILLPTSDIDEARAIAPIRAR